MGRTSAILLSIAIAAVAFAVVAWVLWRWLKNSEDEPAQLIIKWIFSAVVLGGAFYFIRGTPADEAGAFIVPITGAVCGVIMAIIWGRNLVGAISRPFENLYTGGTLEPEPQPVYSVAESRRKQGKYPEAVQAIHQQLAQFPRDVYGQMLLAEIQAAYLNDLPGAQLTIERFCAQPDHAPQNIANALHQLADWQLKFGQDLDAARAALERIRTTLPDTEQAQVAAQRLAHLGSAETLLAPHDRATIVLRAGAHDVGLMADSSMLKRAEEDPAAEAAACVQQLERHPLDAEAREKLAVIYAGHYQRLDLAAGELEQLIQQPNLPAKQTIRWLNLLADLQLKHSGDYDAIRATLQRIIDLNPNAAAAETARQRIDHLRLELKGKEQQGSVKMGDYQRDLGLRK